MDNRGKTTGTYEKISLASTSMDIMKHFQMLVKIKVRNILATPCLCLSCDFTSVSQRRKNIQMVSGVQTALEYKSPKGLHVLS